MLWIGTVEERDCKSSYAKKVRLRLLIYSISGGKGKVFNESLMMQTVRWTNSDFFYALHCLQVNLKCYKICSAAELHSAVCSCLHLFNIQISTKSMPQALPATNWQRLMTQWDSYSHHFHRTSSKRETPWVCPAFMFCILGLCLYFLLLNCP